MKADLETVTFPGARMLGKFGREDAGGGSILFACKLGADVDELFHQMGWPIPTDETTLLRFDTELTNGTMTLTPNRDEKLRLKSKDGGVNTDAQLNIEFSRIGGFSCKRLEGERAGQFQRELLFMASFTCRDGLTEAENYIVRTDNAKGSLRVKYQRPPTQTTIEDLVPDGVTATQEQREAAQEA